MEAQGEVRCPSCNHSHRADRRYCTECGAPLCRACRQCASPVEPGEKFCGRCGAPLTGAVVPPRDGSPAAYTPKHLADKILTSRAALEGERKQVTVLFADVKGSMDLAEQLDPEEWHKILDRFFQILTDGVHRFEGTVNQYTGDGIMALFGAPIAHEDHAQRACYAALHLRDELHRYATALRLEQGLDFAVRTGLNSGEVVVGTIGDDLRMDYTAQGHTVGLAARMEQLAEPGKIFVTEYTARLVGGYFTLADLGATRVKGVAAPLRVYELEGVGTLRTRLDVSRARGFSRFVGRDEEMRELEATLGRVQAGRGQVVGVVADPGVGKSRLCYELAERCRSRGIPVYEAHAVAHGKAIPFLTLLEYLRGYFGIGERDPALAVHEKIAGKLLLLDPGLSEVLPLFFDLLGVPDPQRPAPQMDPEARQRQLFAAMRRLAHAEGQREPGVSLIEDLHWLDGGSEAFLANFVEAVAGTRTLLLVNFRPEYHAAWMQKSYYRQLPLVPLGPEAISALLADLLGTDPSLAGLADLVRERTGGNPFFIEEVVQSLGEAGTLAGAKGTYRLVRPVREVAVPATVHAVLAARIDRLPEHEKTVLQSAAVIGKEFSESVLRRVVGAVRGRPLSQQELAAALVALRAAEFLYEQSLYPEVEYAFKHPLTQEVALHSQLQERRRRTHAAVAGAIQETSPNRLEENAALLAHHCEEAGEALEAARWHRRAALWVGTSDFVEALLHWRRVRELLATLSDSPETLEMRIEGCIRMLDLGWRLGAAEEEAAALFDEGKTLAERQGDLRSLAMLIAQRGIARGFAGDIEGYIRHVCEALRLAESTGDEGLALALALPPSIAYEAAGRVHDALDCIDRALARPPSDLSLGREVLGFSPYPALVSWRATLLMYLGRLDEARRILDQGEELVRRLGEVEVLGLVHHIHVLLAEHTGAAEPALGHARQSVEIAEKLGSPFSRVLGYSALGLAQILCGAWPGAIEAAEAALAIAREARTALYFEAFLLHIVAEALLGAGETRRAGEAAEEAIAVAQRQGARGYEARAHLALARVLLQSEGAVARDRIASTLDRADTLAEETGWLVYLPWIRLERAALARLTGDEAGRARELREAHRLFTDMGATRHAERLARELGA